jgi:hypothetical protein
MFPPVANCFFIPGLHIMRHSIEHSDLFELNYMLRFLSITFIVHVRDESALDSVNEGPVLSGNNRK